MEEHREKVYELAICFSRMWGVAETLEAFPNENFKEIQDRMTAWAEECIAQGREEDFVKFFEEKVRIIRGVHTPGPQRPNSRE